MADTASEERKRVDREVWVRMEMVVALLLHDAHERQVGEAMGGLEEGPEGLYKSHLADLTSH